MRATRDTKAFFGWNWHHLLHFVGFGMGCLFFWWWKGAALVWGEIDVFIAYGLAGIGGVALIVFLFQLAFAPSRMAKDIVSKYEGKINVLNTEVMEVRARVQVLEQERIPMLACRATSGRKLHDKDHEHLMWAELEVQNTSSSVTLHDVQVRIATKVCVQEKQDEAGKFIAFDAGDFSPILVCWSTRNALPKQLGLDIPPDTTRVALIGFCDNDSGSTTILNGPMQPIPWFVGGAKIRVQVSSVDSAMWEAEFYIECHPKYANAKPPFTTDAEMEFIEWESWASTHTVVERRDSHT